MDKYFPLITTEPLQLKSIEKTPVQALLQWNGTKFEGKLIASISAGLLSFIVTDSLDGRADKIPGITVSDTLCIFKKGEYIPDIVDGEIKILIDTASYQASIAAYEESKKDDLNITSKPIREDIKVEMPIKQATTHIVNEVNDSPSPDDDFKANYHISLTYTRMLERQLINNLLNLAARRNIKFLHIQKDLLSHASIQELHKNFTIDSHTELHIIKLYSNEENGKA